MTDHDRQAPGILELAREMFEECRTEEQSARRLESDLDAAAVRAELLRLGRREGLRLRTARMGDTVVVVRFDATIWHESAAEMRRKLTPRD